MFVEGSNIKNHRRADLESKKYENINYRFCCC